ncbi:MAG: mannose-1-phosphate guanylyltransferase/mannose-6-phosphate isomerase [Cyanobacteriota bacterium]|nr:mannose-1-phosphate guanylyltransferase/mannose-6-phosphate isomerase [Cyanobacteriota bacterium]MDY6359134.1 mannose-1-phosphate guanylyltransferase/mannose-6-phosphate isomerase [Cyanobacteriota bacterium]MDY6363602.1 mannose-1-phosphate guanylyltransferase/mannose-6-phosphate isomerase [Cyanobacteriota bacterium]
MKCIILAGGSGSRLWPLSREMYPKQLINFGSKDSLLQQTFLRMENFAKASEIVTVTNVLHYQDIKLQLNKIDDSNVVIAEPLGKNTAPAIASALEYFSQNYKEDDIVLIAPSDHLIRNSEQFKQTVENAKVLAQDGYIVTFGIKPSYPEIGYGYIKTKNALKTGFEVEKFVEKPDYKTAQQYVQSGNYYWNGGIFMAKISVLLDEIKKYAPDIYSKLDKIDYSNGVKLDFDLYNSMPSISIDYAIMEKSDKVALVELLSDWNDLGSWQALYNVKPKDENGNVITGKVVTENVRNSFIYSQKELVAVSDLENVIIVETEDAIMACKMDKSQDVKKLYDKLKAKESDTTKLHKTVFRPWGYYTCMNSGEGYLTKTICVLPHQKLSVQSHNHRSEHWVVLEGTALVLKDGKEYNVYPGDSIDIPVQAKHSLQNPYDENLKIIEIQKGDYISEDDIIRYEDCYGRV